MVRFVWKNSKMIKRYFLLIVLFCGVGMQISYAQESHNFKTTKALDIFNALCEELDLSYVDTLDAEQITEDAIRYMLHRLDPYTEYYKASRTNELKTPQASMLELVLPFVFIKAGIAAALMLPFWECQRA